MIVSTWVVSTLAGYGGGSTNVDGVGTDADFVYLVGIDISSDGLFAVVVCDSSIRRIVISTVLVTTLAGRATAGSTDGVGTNVEFSCPMDGAISNVDGSFVLITDMDNYLIRKVVVSTKVVTRVAGTGASGFTDGIRHRIVF
jgi:hypothetical protein